MIPDLAHRVSVFGLLKPVACRICFDVTLTRTIYVPVMSPSSQKTGIPPRPAGRGLNSRLSVDTRSLNGRYVEQICVTCFPITSTSQDERPFLARANNVALTGIGSVDVQRHVTGIPRSAVSSEP